MFDYQFEWKNPQAGKVFVTGNFDNWQQVNELEKQPDGTFKKVIPLPSSEEKILYKFVVDGNWVIDNSMPVEEDGRGNQNNYINIPVENLGTVAAAAEGNFAPNKDQEEEERLIKEEEERLKREEEERIQKQKEEEERLKREEEERLKREEEERLKREEEERLKREEEEKIKKQKEEEERLKKEQEEKIKKQKEEEERLKKEQEAKIKKQKEEEKLKKEQEKLAKEKKLRKKQLKDNKKVLNDDSGLRERSKAVPKSKEVPTSPTLKQDLKFNENATKYVFYGLTTLAIVVSLVYLFVLFNSKINN